MLKLTAFELQDRGLASFTIRGNYEEIERVCTSLFGAVISELSTPVDLSNVTQAVKEAIRENGVRVA